MSKRGKKQYDTRKRTCLDCANAVPCGEGDFICDAGDEPAFVIEDYAPGQGFRTGCEEWTDR